MKKFKFRLEKILEHKIRIFELAQDAYLVQQKKLQEEECALERIKNEYTNCLRKIVDKTKESFTIKELAIHYKYIYYIKREIKVQFNRVQNRKMVLEERRKELVVAAQEKEVLVKLKEKRWQEYRVHIDREEQKVMDDIFSAKHARACATAQ